MYVLVLNNFLRVKFNCEDRSKLSRRKSVHIIISSVLTYPGGYTELTSSPMLSLTVISAMLPELTASWRVRDMVTLTRPSPH